MIQLDQAFQTLGLQPGITYLQAKSRFRELVKTSHPDKVFTEREKRQAELRIKKVVESFELVRSHYKGVHGEAHCHCTRSAVTQPKPQSTFSGSKPQQSNSSSKPQPKPKQNSSKPKPQAKPSPATRPTASNSAVPRQTVPKTFQDQRESDETARWRNEFEARKSMHEDARKLYLQSVRKKRDSAINYRT